MPFHMFATWARYLFFRARPEEMAGISWRRFLGPALVATWLAGMGRYWDHPSASLLQMLGVGSVVYVFVLGALLWAVIAPLRPRGWGYLQVVTFVSLTAPPALLYALPVERWMTLDQAVSANESFLLVVAGWRVALLLVTLHRHAQLTWPRALVGAALPLCAIVTALAALNLEHAVFEIMGGFRQGTPGDGAYMILVLLTWLSFMASVPLLLIYLLLVRRARRRLAESARAA